MTFISVVSKIRIVSGPAKTGLLDGQSKILNWGYNQGLQNAQTARKKLAQIYAFYKDPRLPEEVRQEIVAPMAQALDEVYGRYGPRNYLTSLKDQHPFMRLVHSSPMKNAGLRLVKAIAAAKKGDNDWPKFRRWSKKWFSLEYDERNKGWKAAGKKLSLSFGERVVPDEELSDAALKAVLKKRQKDPTYVKKERLGVELDLAEVVPSGAKRVEITKEHGVYYACFTVRVGVKPREMPDDNALRVAYFDPNHSNFAVGRTTEGKIIHIDNPVWQKANRELIDKLKRKRDRCDRKARLVEFTRDDGSVHRHYEPSRRWKRFDAALKRAESRRREQNKTYMYSVAHAMFRGADIVGIGDYAPNKGSKKLGKTKKRQAKANRAMMNESLIGRFKTTLLWVAEKSGNMALIVDERGTTRTCSLCDHVVREGIPVGIKSWTCPSCDTVHHRDENAAENGLVRVLSLTGNSQMPRSGHLQRCTWRYVPDKSGAWGVVASEAAAAMMNQTVSAMPGLSPSGGDRVTPHDPPSLDHDQV